MISKMANCRCFLTGLLIAAVIFQLDQMTKNLIIGEWLSHEKPEIVITSFFSLVSVWNYGISFGMFAEQRMPYILVGASTVIILILLGWLYKNASLTVAIALGCIIGGASGNILDRLRFGAVADFLDFHVGGWHWPAFNLADSAIFIGVVLLCASSMFMERAKQA